MIAPPNLSAAEVILPVFVTVPVILPLSTLLKLLLEFTKLPEIVPLLLKVPLPDILPLTLNVPEFEVVPLTAVSKVPTELSNPEKLTTFVLYKSLIEVPPLTFIVPAL